MKIASETYDGDELNDNGEEYMNDEEKQDSSEDEETDDASETHQDEASKTKTPEEAHSKRRGKQTREQRAVNKRRRMLGKPYRGLKKNEKGQFSLTHKRSARKMGAACKADTCLQSKIRHCASFSPSERQKMFDHFWQSFTWDMKRTYIATLVDYVSTKRTKEESRRKGTLRYYLKKGSEKLQVCKTMFLSTLGLNEWTVRAYCKKEHGMIESEDNISHASRNRNTRRKEDDKKFLIDFMKELPKLESHYCRASTSNLYLEPTFQSKADLYNEYVNRCTQEQVSPVSRPLMISEIKKIKLKIFKPRKDQCDTCIAHKLGNLDDEAFLVHQRKKNECREEKTTDKETAAQRSEETAVFTMDVQAVKLSPLLKASAIYYKTKLCVHNYTFFDLIRKDVTCFLWDESQGGLDADHFATMVSDFLTNYLSRYPQTKEITFFSDGCGYQNRNSVVSNALLKFACDKQITVYQKYFEKGHSQMEVDSVHSTIERKLRNRDIYLPTDYISVCREARIKHPYVVKYLHYTDFKCFRNVQYYSSIRPGCRRGDPQVNDVCSFQYLPCGEIRYKINYTDNYTPLPRRPKTGKFDVTPLYKNRPKIKPEKYAHLQALKTVIDRCYWQFHDELPH